MTGRSLARRLDAQETVLELVGSASRYQRRIAEHFRLDGARIEPVTKVGATTVRLLRMNAPERILERDLLQSSGR